MQRKTIARACLFGGALCAAGITVDAADDEFVIGSITHNNGYSTGAYAYVYTLDGGFANDSDIGPPVGPFGAYAYIAGTSTFNQSDIVLSLSELSATNIKSDGASFFNYTAAAVDFMVTDTVDVTISWNVDTGIDGEDRVFELLSTTPFTTLFDYQALTPAQQASGSTTLTLSNTACYRVEFLFRSLNGEGEGAFSITTNTIPECFADCDGNGTLNIDDIDCFVTSFLAGCP